MVRSISPAEAVPIPGSERHLLRVRVDRPNRWALAQRLGEPERALIELVNRAVSSVFASGGVVLALDVDLELHTEDQPAEDALRGGFERACAANKVRTTNLAVHRSLRPTALSALCTGVVSSARILGPERLAAGDVLYAIASPAIIGPLLTRLASAPSGELERIVPEFGTTLGRAALVPSRGYRGVIGEAHRRGLLKAVGLVEDDGPLACLGRLVPRHLDLTLVAERWPFVYARSLTSLGDLSRALVEHNAGAGLFALVNPNQVDQLADLVAQLFGKPGGSVGELVPGTGLVRYA